MPNGNDDLDQYEPSWMSDGYGISGPQEGGPDEDLRDYDIFAGEDIRSNADDYKAVSQQDETVDQPLGSAGACPPDTPPTSGTWVWGAVGGTCQWISTTTCP